MIEIDYQNATPEEIDFVDEVLLFRVMGKNYHKKGSALYEMGASRKYWTRRLEGIRITEHNNFRDNTSRILLIKNMSARKIYVRIIVPKDKLNIEKF